MNKKKHIIFDWNGTLVDDASIFVDILNQLLVSRSLNTITLSEYKNVFCFPIKSFYKKLGIDISEKSFTQLEKEFVNEYNQRMFKPKLFNNVLTVLNSLKKEGFELSILSASNQKVLSKLIKYYSLTQYFDNVVGVNNYGANGKIESGQNLLKEINQTNDQIIMVGDTDYDYQVAKNLQIDCILIGNGHQSLNKLKSVTKEVVNSLEEIMNIVL